MSEKSIISKYSSHYLNVLGGPPRLVVVLVSLFFGTKITSRIFLLLKIEQQKKLNGLKYENV